MSPRDPKIRGSSGSRNRGRVLAGLTVWALLLVLAFWAASGSDEEEITAAIAEVEALRAELEQQSCERAAMPGASGEASDLRALIDSPDTPPWLQTVELRRALFGENDEFLQVFAHFPSVPQPQFTYPVMRDRLLPELAPLYPAGNEPLPLVEQRSRVAGLRGFLDAHMGRQTHCSPLVGVHPDATRNMATSLSRNVVVLARGLAQDGQLADALGLLLQGVVLLRDLRLGPVELEHAVHIGENELFLFAQFQALLLVPVQLTESEVDRVLQGLRFLQTSHSPLYQYVLGTTAMSSERARFNGEEDPRRALDALRTLELLNELCGQHDLGLSDCREAFSRSEPRFSLGRLTESRERAQRAEEIRVSRVAFDLSLLWAAHTATNQMESLVLLVKERAAGRCPPESSLTQPTNPAALSLAPLADQPSQFVIRSAITNSRSILFLCPAGVTNAEEVDFSDIGPIADRPDDTEPLDDALDSESAEVFGGP